MEDKVKENAEKLLEVQHSLKGYSEKEVDSFHWAGAVTVMVLSDIGYIDLNSDLNMGCLIPRWKLAMKIANSSTEPYYDYIMAVCFFTTLYMLREYGHFKDVANLKETIAEAIENISDKILLIADSYVNDCLTGKERDSLKCLFRNRVQMIGDDMGSSAYNCMSEE